MIRDIVSIGTHETVELVVSCIPVVTHCKLRDKQRVTFLADMIPSTEMAMATATEDTILTCLQRDKQQGVGLSAP